MLALIITLAGKRLGSNCDPLPLRRRGDRLGGAEDDLAELTCLFHAAVRRRGVRERERLVDHGAEAALAEELEHGRELSGAAHGGAEQRRLLPEEIAKHEVLHRTRGGAEARDAPAGLENLHALG